MVVSSYAAIVLPVIFAAIVAVFLSILGDSASHAFAQESTERYILHRVEIWGLFYRLMVVAFVIGAVVMGTIGYIVWRFRESHPKNRVPAGGDIAPARTTREGGHH